MTSVPILWPLLCTQAISVIPTQAGNDLIGCTSYPRNHISINQQWIQLRERALENTSLRGPTRGDPDPAHYTPRSKVELSSSPAALDYRQHVHSFS